VTQDLIVARRGGLLEAEVDGEMVGLHVDNGACYGFNSTATRIWAMIETPRPLGALRDALVEEFDVAPTECEAQLLELLEKLQADGLVELRPA
jgi:hypothetical protein